MDGVYECGAQAAPPTMMARLHSYLGMHMGREWGKKKKGSSFLLFCSPMLTGARS